ncbi:hypothetical protein Tco_0006138 [Tanacetum coccineum]
MDPNTSIGRLCLGENNQGSVAKGIENKEQWEGPEFQDIASNRQEREAKFFTFYRIKEEGEHYFTPCYMGGLHTYCNTLKSEHAAECLNIRGRYTYGSIAQDSENDY